MIAPENTEFVLLSFEGPDVYSQAGGLGVRERELARALARAGFRTHLFFVGDPGKPGVESWEEGRLTLHRWCQWISQYYLGGVYQGEEQKLKEWNSSLPYFIVNEIATPAAHEGRRVVVLAEEWHTAWTTILLSDLLHLHGLRQHATLLWNANNLYGFWSIDFPRLSFVSAVTTVSRYMKHRMWDWGVNPIVIPNGIPEDMLVAVPAAASRMLRRALGGDVALFKIGRFDPDKRWLMAVQSVAAMKGMGMRARLLLRGGKEPYGGQVLYTAASYGLHIAEIAPEERTLESLCEAIKAAPDADLLNITSFLADEVLPPIYAGVDAVLANSSHEPFGLVGLEVMACKGLAVTGSSGEDYAEPQRNAVVLDTDDPMEIVAALRFMKANPARAKAMRAAGFATAQAYTWPKVLDVLFEKLDYISMRGGG